MLIIFDLDDTLVDTSGCVTPVRLQAALEEMIQGGLVVSDRAQAWVDLQTINEQVENSREALSCFLAKWGQETPALYAMGVRAVYEEDAMPMPISPLPGAQEVLKALAEEHQLALVTIGRPVQQMEKMKKAGIDSSVFSRIIVSEDRDKKKHYQQLQRELQWDSDRVVVCGDRVGLDLTPAADLGFWTVQMTWGRGRFSKGNVDYRIDSLSQVRDIVQKIQHKERT